jgi:hypothetical protein
MDEDYEVFEDAEDGLDDHPPYSGPLLPSDGGDHTVSSGPIGPRPDSTPPLVEELVTVINL